MFYIVGKVSRSPSFFVYSSSTAYDDRTSNDGAMSKNPFWTFFFKLSTKINVSLNFSKDKLTIFIVTRFRSAFNTDEIGKLIAIGLEQLIQSYPIEKIHIIGEWFGDANVTVHFYWHWFFPRTQFGSTYSRRCWPYSEHENWKADSSYYR